MRWVALRAWAVLAAMTIAGCGGSSRNPTAPTTPPTAAVVTAVVVTSASTSSSSIQLAATAQMSDGTSRDVTSTATWQSSNPVLAAVSATGLVTIVGSGEVDVRATYQSVTGSLHLVVARLPVAAVTVSGSPSSVSLTFQLQATARLADGSTQDVTRSATWQSSNAQLASVSATGLVTILGSGEVDLRATYQGVTGSTHVAVSLPKTFSLRGTVAEIAPNVQPIAGARVQIVVGDHTFTDNLGAFTLSGLPAGRTIVEVTRDGYETWSNEVLMDRDVRLAVSLNPTPPKNAEGVTATARCNDRSWSWAQTRAEACAANSGIAYTVCPGPLCSQ